MLSLSKHARYARPLRVRISKVSTTRPCSSASAAKARRAQGLGNVLASRAPALGKAGLARARQAFAEAADAQGRVVETFEILTLSGHA